MRQALSYRGLGGRETELGAGEVELGALSPSCCRSEIHAQARRTRLFDAPTEAGRDAWKVLEAVGEWGDRWTDVLPEHADPDARASSVDGRSTGA